MRHYEQVLLHYRRHIADPITLADRKRLIGLGKGRWPWANDRLYPEKTLEQAAVVLKEIREELSEPMRVLADAILKEQGVWRGKSE